MGETLFPMSRVRSTTDAVNSGGSSFAEMLPLQSSLWHRHDGSSESVAPRKTNPNIARHLSWDTLPPGSTQAGHDSNREIFTLRQFWLKHNDAIKVLIMDQGTEFGADFQHLSQSRGILPVVTDLETRG